MSETKDRMSTAARALGKRGASKGGKARASVLTQEERRDIAQKAVAARWRKEKGENYSPPLKVEAQVEKAVEPKAELPYSMFPGKLMIGGLELECHVLNDLRRVFTQREMVRVITGGVESGNLRPYLDAIAFKNKELLAGEIIRFRIPQQPTVSNGYEATLLLEICEAYLQARDETRLAKNQLHLAKQAEIITRVCAKVGIIALIDEATGYQKVRADQALQLKLQAFIADEIQEWARMFPEEFWLELARLEGIRYSPRSRPLRWGKYVMAFVYDAIDGDVGKKLRKLNPDPQHGSNHHQWLKQFGRDRVNNQLQRVIAVMKLCDGMEEFKRKFARVFKKTAYQISFDDVLGRAN